MSAHHDGTTTALLLMSGCKLFFQRKCGGMSAFTGKTQVWNVVGIVPQTRDTLECVAWQVNAQARVWRGSEFALF